MKEFASYEKEIISKIETTRHIVRIRLNDSAANILQILEKVPINAIVKMVVDDSELEGYGEIIFEEEKTV